MHCPQPGSGEWLVELWLRLSRNSVLLDFTLFIILQLLFYLYWHINWEGKSYKQQKRTIYRKNNIFSNSLFIPSWFSKSPVTSVHGDWRSCSHCARRKPLSSGISEGTHMTYIIVLKYMGHEKRAWICHRAWDLVGTSWDEGSKFVSRTFTVSHHISNQSL